MDPTDTDEGLTAEMLGATDVLEYANLAEEVAELRIAIQAVGVKPVARASGVSRSEVQEIVNGGATPQAATLAKLELVVKKLRAAKAQT